MSKGTDRGGKMRHEPIGHKVITCGICGRETSKRQSVRAILSEERVASQRLIAADVARRRLGLPSLVSYSRICPSCKEA